MRIIFTRSRSPLSVLIRWIFEEPVSHMAIVFDARLSNGTATGLVFQSNLLGCHVDDYGWFLGHNTVVFAIECPLVNPAMEEAIYQRLIQKTYGRGWDFRGAAFLAWRGLLHRFFKSPIPATNPWNNDRAWFCDELGALLAPEVRVPAIASISMMTPYRFFLAMREMVG